MKGERDLKYDLDCGFNIWVYNGYRYVIPWGEYKYYENFRSQQTDYCYWNSTDALPKGVTKQEWDKRGRRWEAAMKDGVKLVHQTIKLSNKVGAWPLITQYLGDKAKNILILGYDDDDCPSHNDKTIRDFMVVT